MRYQTIALLAAMSLAACTSNTYYDPLRDYEQLDVTMILDAPTPVDVAPENRESVSRGEYLVELLGCGSCHTDGALIGEADLDRPLAGSSVGIAYTSPLENRYPGVVYPPNITPDDDTGIGRWSDQQIVNAVRAGLGRHGERRILIMPWQGYAQITNDDAAAIVGYLGNIKPIRHEVPGDVPVGTMAGHPYVHFGIYRTRGLIIE
jgi:hypothetical protein